jgi:hypothetical protein
VDDNMNKYTLVPMQGSELDKYKVTIEADSNDADYITTINYYTPKWFNDYVIDGLIDLKQNASGDYQLENYGNPYDLDIPYNGYDGYCHSLESVRVEYIDKEGKLWTVKY